MENKKNKEEDIIIVLPGGVVSSGFSFEVVCVCVCELERERM